MNDFCFISFSVCALFGKGKIIGTSLFLDLEYIQNDTKIGGNNRVHVFTKDEMLH